MKMTDFEYSRACRPGDMPDGSGWEECDTIVAGGVVFTFYRRLIHR
jgi:hypothetical protein